MKLIITKNYETLSELAAGIVLEKMMKDKRVNLSLTAGNSPKGMYDILINRLKDTSFDTSSIYYYNFDEVPIEGERYGLTMGALREIFYVPAAIATENIQELTIENYEAFDEKISHDGGLDLVVMGLGSDGHFCANMPNYTSFDKEVFSVEMGPGHKLWEELYEMLGKKPGNKMVTYGPKTIMKAKHLLLIVNGKSKADIVKKVIQGPVTESIPATILMTHPNITVILDEEAAQYL